MNTHSSKEARKAAERVADVNPRALISIIDRNHVKPTRQYICVRRMQAPKYVKHDYPRYLSRTCVIVAAGIDAAEHIFGNDDLYDDLDDLNWQSLSISPNAIPLLERHIDRVCWSYLSTNPGAIHILRKHVDKIDWTTISFNSAAIPLIEKYLDRVNWYTLCKNPNAIRLIERRYETHPDDICGRALSANPNAVPLIERIITEGRHVCWRTLSRNPAAIPLLERHPEKIDWVELSRNPAAIHMLLNACPDDLEWGWISANPAAIPLLERHPERIHWYFLARNPNAAHLLRSLDERRIRWFYLWSNPDLMWLLEKNMDKVEWIQFSRNPAAIHLLRQNLETVDWDSLSSNSNIMRLFDLDYAAMRRAIQPLAEELAQRVNDPRRYRSPEEFIERQIILGFREDTE